MMTTNLRNETETTEAPHPRLDEHLGRNTFGEHPEVNLLENIEKLLCDFENYQQQQLQILRAIAHRTTDTFQPADVGPIVPTNERRTVQVPPEIHQMIQDWNNRQSPQRKRVGAYNAFIPKFFSRNEVKEFKAPIWMCVTKMPDAPKDSLSLDLPISLHARFSKHKQDFDFDPRNAICDTWTAIQYRLDSSGWAASEIGLDYFPTENDPVCARIIHDFIEYHHLTVHRIFQIINLFVNFSALPEDQDKLSSHIMKFVLEYAMEWKVLKWHNPCTNGISTLQFSLRFFEIPLGDQGSDIERIKRQPGHLPQSELLRETGYIPLPRRTGSTISERRVSVFMAYGRRMNTPYWTIFNFSGQNSPRTGNGGTEEMREYFLDGISHFQAWYNLLDMELQNCLHAWQKLLSEMDVGIGLRIEELCDPQTLGDLMRDGNDSKRSEFYFISFSMLRRFADCIEETLEDLEHCCQELNGRLEEDGTAAEGKEKIQEISKKFLETHRGNLQDLLHQIQRKINMVMPLQESLFNSTSIREASEATHQGRYIFVFTMMTIVYLPLGFVTSLFGMNNITENSPLATSTAPFAVTFSVVAAVTYIIASGSFPFANRTKFRPMLAPIWNSLRLLLEKWKKKTLQQLERRHLNREVELMTYPDPPNSSSEARALGRYFSFFKPRRPQPAEAIGDIEMGVRV